MAKRYRGGGRVRRFIASLAAVLITIAAAFCIVYFVWHPVVSLTDDGINISFGKPRAVETQAPPTPEKTPVSAPTTMPSIELVLKPSPTPTAEPTPSPTPAPTVKGGVIRAIYASYKSIETDARVKSLIELAESGVINCIVLEAKRDDGVDLTKDARIKNVSKKFKDAGVYLIARVSALKDSAKGKSSIGLKNTAGEPWKDADGRRWLNPYEQGTREYLAEVAVRCVELGFDEVLFDNLHFPISGDLDKLAELDESAVSRDGIIAQLLDELIVAAGDIPVSAFLTEVCVRYGTDATAAQSLAALSPILNRVFCFVEGAELERLREAYRYLTPAYISLEDTTIIDKELPELNPDTGYVQWGVNRYKDDV